MSTARFEPERIDLARADDPRDVVHQAVAALAQGECVALASDRVVGTVASALAPEAVARVCLGLTPAPGSPPLTLLLRGADELADWIPGLSPTSARIARRAWPGRVTLVFDPPSADGLLQRLDPSVRQRLEGPEGFALQTPAALFLRDVLNLLPGPLVFRPARPGDGPTAESSCRLIVHSAASDQDANPTVVRLDPQGWRLLRPGAVSEADIQRMAGTLILFVCTGNTCRSPMAEALCKILLGKRLGCEPGELESRGFVVLSAGIAAVPGMPAAAHAIDVVKARGGSLRDHASRKLTLDLVRHADLILTMTADHLEALLDSVPEAASRARPLHPDGYDVADPVGADRETYQRTADAIESYLAKLLDEFGL